MNGWKMKWNWKYYSIQVYNKKEYFITFFQLFLGYGWYLVNSYIHKHPFCSMMAIASSCS